jgi:DNA primase
MRGVTLPPQFLDELRARTSLVSLIGAHVRLTRKGREHSGCCPFHGEKTPSFTVVEEKGFAHCFGCSWHNDAIGFVMDIDGRSFMDAVRLLAADAGMVVPGDDGAPVRPLAPVVARPAPDAIDHDRERDIRWARERFAQAVPWRGTPVEAYLRSRRCCPDDDVAALRYFADLKYRDRWPDGRPCNGAHPAMVAAIQRPDKSIGGLHRTYLAAGGQGKADVPIAKKMRGDSWGGAIRFAPAGPVLALAEGIETGLSVRRAVPGLPIWVAGSLGNIAGSGDRDAPKIAHPTRPGKQVPTVLPDLDRPGIVLPERIRKIIILADADGDRVVGRALVERAARRFDALGIDVVVAWPPDGMDFNDILMEGEDEKAQLALIRSIVEGAKRPVLTDPAAGAIVAPAAARTMAPRPVPQAQTRVWGDRAAAAQIWADCLPLARGVPQGLAYLRRMGAPVPDEPTSTSMALYKRLRVGVMPRLHVGANGAEHDLGRHPCLVAAYGARGAKGLLRIWLDVDGRAQSRIADPDMPERALSPYELIGEVAGEAVHFGDMAEGAAVAVTLECALASLRAAPGPVWAVDTLPAAAALDLPQGLRRVYLVVWQAFVMTRSVDADGQVKASWGVSQRREDEISAVAWKLSAEGQRELLRVDQWMPRGWSPLPGRPTQVIEDEADISRWENEGGAIGHRSRPIESPSRPARTGGPPA